MTTFGGDTTGFRSIASSHLNHSESPDQREIAVIVATCEHKNRRTNGKTKAGAIRYRCKDCGKSWTESTSTLGGMRMGLDRAAQVIELLCEGMSVRGTSRIT